MGGCESPLAVNLGVAGMEGAGGAVWISRQCPPRGWLGGVGGLGAEGIPRQGPSRGRSRDGVLIGFWAGAPLQSVWAPSQVRALRGYNSVRVRSKAPVSVYGKSHVVGCG